MPLNQQLKGKRYQPVSLTVEPDHVLAFADAIGEENPIFRDQEVAARAGYRDQLAPPTFVTVMQIMGSRQVIQDPDLGLDYSRVVHAEQEYDWKRPAMVGDRLSAVPTIADFYNKGPNELLVIEAEVTDASGDTVVIGRTTLLSRGTAVR